MSGIATQLWLQAGAGSAAPYRLCGAALYADSGWRVDCIGEVCMPTRSKLHVDCGLVRCSSLDTAALTDSVTALTDSVTVHAHHAVSCASPA